MKKLPLIFLFALLCAGVVQSCKSGEDDEDKLIDRYLEWRDTNATWLKEQQERKNPDGTPYYTTVVPVWNPDAYVLVHYFNDRSLTAGNLQPMSTSTVDTRYYLTYCNGTPIDSSYNMTSNGPGIFRTKANAVITGWTIALEDMHVGDSIELIVPYQFGYGVSTTSGVAPFSNLKFNMSLVDIPYYEKNPK